ncbi:hypothetical protein [Paludibacter sp.]|uniref:hypothetical protein n=1 Tax=Paludibacter sp. TaxID=1898105 RepID=UPI0013530098|nr:hypothetical protein [Paludibacter sp.]MTK54281.1 hypothetical protein [Paludibacter sp.]
MRNYLLSIIMASAIVLSGCTQSGKSTPVAGNADKNGLSDAAPKKQEPVDSIAYNKKLAVLANGDTTGRWPVKHLSYPMKGAILPYNRIVAYYGNLYSKRMGVLGEYAPDTMWTMLRKEMKAWEAVDPSTPVIPAIHYIAVVAQGNPGKDGKYRMRMPAHQIDSALTIAKMGNAIVFLDIQVALSHLKDEVPLLEKYLKMPHVHLAIDPEFSMKDGSLPGKKIGTFDAEDVNYCSEYLADLVKQYNLPPKILIVHRFTQGMVTNYKQIKHHQEVQMIMNMDGWGAPYLKYDTYRQYIFREPVQFTGFKLFYKNDIKNPPHHMLTPPELINLRPKPIYIQYQ